MRNNTGTTPRTPWLVAAFAAASLSLAVAVPGGHAQGGRKTTDPPTASRGKLGQDLFLAIDHRDVKAVKALIQQGADPNSRNGLEFTPLYIAAASHQPEVMNALLAAGAQPDAESPYGSPLLFAAASANLNGAKILFEKGANPNTARVDGNTVLMTASFSGNPAFVAELLKRKVDVNATNIAKATALHYAARTGNVEVCRQLIEAGANLEAADAEGFTPLMSAAMTGNADVTQLLVSKGAKVEARDEKRRTALMLAAMYGGNPGVVKVLVDAGADTKAVDLKKRTAGKLAGWRGYGDIAMMLGEKGTTSEKRFTRNAVDLSLRALQSSMTEFAQSAACISCHQEGLGRMATSVAQQHGFKLDSEVQQMQRARIAGALNAMQPLHEQALKSPEAMKQLPLIEINEVSSGDSWFMAGMAFQKDVPTKATAAMAQVLARQQQKSGVWSFSLPRIPMQSSPFTLTALAAKSIATYGGSEYSAENKERLARAKAWLMSAPAKTSDDLTFRLLGLLWTGTPKAERQSAMSELLKAQNADGGWSQVPGMRSDAYATGQALYALLQSGGLNARDEACQKAVDYLLRTQDEDGTWFVNKRAFAANNYFDAGFSHGESQFASFNATCWAVMALSETLGK